MYLLPAHTQSVAMVRFAGPKVPTHTARYQVKRKYVGGHEWDVIGSIDVDVASDQDMRRLRLLDARLHYTFAGIEVSRVMLPREDAQVRRALDHLQRFKRKMGMVLRAYEEEKQQVLAQKFGLFIEDELVRLDADLQEAWAKAEQIYGHTKEDYYKPQHAL